MSDKKIEVHTDKKGKRHVNIYDSDPSGEHASIHINIDPNTGKGNIVDTTGGSKETTDTQCYLTTACMRHFMENFDDNCYELNTLRWFRDNFVSTEDILYYYEVAPIIVENIQKLVDNEEIYDYIYNNIVKVCVEAIENQDYDFAYSRYKSSVISLNEQFGVKEENFVKKLNMAVV